MMLMMSEGVDEEHEQEDEEWVQRDHVICSACCQAHFAQGVSAGPSAHGDLTAQWL